VQRNRNITSQGTKENNLGDDSLRGLPGKPPGSPLFFEWMEGDGVVKGKRTYSKIKKGM
jgi:hypothetical protein